MKFNATLFSPPIHSIHYLQPDRLLRKKPQPSTLSTLLLGKIILAEILPHVQTSDKPEAVGHFCNCCVVVRAAN